MTEVFSQPLNQQYLIDSITSTLFPKLKSGRYAFVKKSDKNCSVLKFTPSKGTAFYKDTKMTLELPFEKIQECGKFPFQHVERNASPAGSESQEYEPALLFEV